MTGDEITFVLCSIDSLTKENCELRARLEAVEQNTKSLSTCSAAAECHAPSDELTTDEIALLCSNDVEPLSKKRLDEIIQSIGATKSTWSDLRQLYPPRQSDFAPRIELDDEFDVDEAYSQAATMSAYGVELLRVALGCHQVDRRLTRQTSHLLASLCASLLDTRDRRRRARTTHGNSKPEDEGLNKHAKQGIELKPSSQIERTDSPCINKRKGAEYWDSSYSSSESSDSGSTYSNTRRRRHVKHAKQSDTCIVRDIDSTENVSVTAPIVLAPEDSACKGGDTSATNSDVEDESDVVIGQGQVERLNRRVVIRNAFLSHGLSELDGIAYYNRWTKDTNYTYDGVWNRWVVWCDKRGLNPTVRSEEDLATYISDIAMSKTSATRMRIVARSVWSVVDGTALPNDTGQ
ncbi:hypothetical protein FBU31_000364 [Coemansia sp. 'formosensis']|nr:hypothetical protein FBU31_000364 [Coemansia sp. 'formosensis']